MRKSKRLFLGILAFVVIILVVMFVGITDGLNEGKEVALDGIDLATVPDGSYTGTYDFKRWSNTLTVHVEDHKIAAIEVNEDVSAAAMTDCADEVIMRVIEAQSTDIDAVSGATVTSKAYLKAIENALGDE